MLHGTIEAMRRVEPDPPVVLIPGDFLGHQKYDRTTAVRIAATIAREFDRAFPHAQFVIALGNEDSACGDYGFASGDPFLRAFARAWEPLVNRHGAAPGFASGIVRDGFYTASLPRAGLRAVVLDDVFWSPRYHRCAGAPDVSAEPLRRLQAALHDPRARSWLILHIPPGIDAFSTTHLTHRLVVVPFLDPAPRTALTSLVDDPASRVPLIVSGHVHKFSYRIVGAEAAAPAPLLVAPSVSPIFRNAPSFLALDVDAAGTPTGVREYSLGPGGWREEGSLASLGVHAFTTPELRGLQRRLRHEPQLRARYAELYEGGAPSEITSGIEPAYWCSAEAGGSSDFRRCLEAGGVGILTGRGIVAVALAALLALALAGTGFVLVRRRR